MGHGPVNMPNQRFQMSLSRGLQRFQMPLSRGLHQILTTQEPDQNIRFSPVQLQTSYGVDWIIFIIGTSIGAVGIYFCVSENRP